MLLHAGRIFFVLVTSIASVAAAVAPSPAPCHRIVGEWVGEMDGEFVVWNFDAEGRARLNERCAVFAVSHDTLRVTYDAPLRAAADTPAEVAIYRFLASDPQQGPSRLFVYGFDLGKSGVWLQPAPVEPALNEDAAPPVPPGPSGTPSQPTESPGQTAAAAVPAPRPR